MAAATGIPLALLATTAYNAGLVLEKRALDQLPSIDVRRVVSLARTLISAPQWLAGFGLMLCGLAFQVIVLTFEPVTLVQPVLACGVAVVLVLSHVLLREQLDRRELACVAVLGVSLLCLALSLGGPAAGAGHDASSILMAMVVAPSCVLGLLVGTSAMRGVRGRHQAPDAGVSYGVGTGLLYGVAALAIKALSGVLSDYQGLAHTIVALVSSPYLYLMAGCSVAALGLFQTALQRCRASIVVPTSSIVGSVYFMVAGSWLFHEQLPSDPVKLTLRLAGILVASFVLIALPRQATMAPPTSPPATRRADVPRQQEGDTYAPGKRLAADPRLPH
jgi:multidrug transporter EmrE-like cation transporter